MIEVLATGEYYAELGVATDSTILENLRPMLGDVCRERFRRIDRFTQLALLGSGRCVQGLRLPANTGLYISSGFGSIANTVSVQQQIFVEHRVPKPLNFINTLSNSAGYYVARNLDLRTRNQFVGHDVAPTETALQLALLDLALGNVECALVGVVDETSEPLSEHARRLGVQSDAVLAEGSHWFLLRTTTGDEPVVALDDVQMLHGADELLNWLAGSKRNSDTRIWLADYAEEVLDVCSAFVPFAPNLGAYRSRTAGVVMRFLAGADGRELVTVAPDNGRFHVMRFIRNF